MAIKIFLLNVHSDRNSGDSALSKVTVEQLQTNFPGAQITLSMNDPHSYTGDLTALDSYFSWIRKQSGAYHLPRLAWLFPATLIPVFLKRYSGKTWLGLTPKPIRQWVKTYLDADLIVSTAGGFYRTSGRGSTLLLTMYSLALAIFGGKPLYIFPQSIGPFAFGWERRVSRWLYSRARLVMVREPITIQYLKECSISESKCILLPDVAFGFTGESREAAESWLRAFGLDPKLDRPMMGMTVMNWEANTPNFKHQAVYEESIKAAIRRFVQQYQGKVLILPQTWGPTPAEDDRITARRLVDELPEIRGEVFAIEQPLPPELLQAVYGEMDLVLGTRMHSNIFSICRFVPVLPVGYLQKSAGIADMVGLSEWVTDIHTVTPETLIDKLDCLMEQRTEIRAHLETVIPPIIEESRKPGKLVADDFRQLMAHRG